MTGAGKGTSKSRVTTRSGDAKTGKQIAAVKALLDAMPGACVEPVVMPRGGAPVALMYKLMGKMFAVLSVRGDAFVVVNCDPALIEVLRETYAGAGHRTHLDRRFWISLDLGGDVPLSEVRKLVSGSYDLIHAKLTGKQKEALAASVR